MSECFHIVLLIGDSFRILLLYIHRRSKKDWKWKLKNLGT
jgi:hypothetical protein